MGEYVLISICDALHDNEKEFIQQYVHCREKSLQVSQIADQSVLPLKKNLKPNAIFIDSDKISVLRLHRSFLCKRD